MALDYATFTAAEWETFAAAEWETFLVNPQSVPTVFFVEAGEAFAAGATAGQAFEAAAAGQAFIAGANH